MTAEPTPLRSSGISASAADAVVAMVTPMPAPTSAIQAATKPLPEVMPVPAPSSSPPASRTKPAATVSLAPMSRAIRSAEARRR